MKLFSTIKHDLVPVPETAARGDAENTASSSLDAKEAGAYAKAQPESERVSEDVQLGVQKIEATTAVWSKWHLILAYIL